VNKQERTYEILRDRIHNGAYPPMARLNIDALAREFGVSPIPVREALRRLEAQGWVQFKPNAGAIVSPVDATSWEQAMVALAILRAPPPPRLSVTCASPTSPGCGRSRRPWKARTTRSGSAS
jgi:DNA-binding GntR family transcriptional regulator